MANYVLVSPPGAGKDTLVEALIKIGGFKSVSTGEIYRKQKELETELGLKAYSEYWSKGLICPDEMTNEIMKEALKDITGHETLLINGYPRSRNQAEYLDDIFKVEALIHLDASDGVVISRLLKRGRIDDTPDVIKKRLQVYYQHANEIVDYYKKTNRYIRLNANEAQEEIFHEAYKKIV